MKSTFQQAVLILGIALIAALVTAFVHPKRPPWFEVSDPVEERWNLSVEGARKIVAENDQILWVDARDSSLYKERHFPEAISLNTDEWGDLMFQNMDTLQAAMGNPVIVYCDGSACDKSREVALRLRELLGMDPVYVLKGDWKKVRL